MSLIEIMGTVQCLGLMPINRVMQIVLVVNFSATD